MPRMGGMRLNAYLARAGVASRRGADGLPADIPFGVVGAPHGSATAVTVVETMRSVAGMLAAVAVLVFGLWLAAAWGGVVLLRRRARPTIGLLAVALGVVLTAWSTLDIGLESQGWRPVWELATFLAIWPLRKASSVAVR